MSLTVFLSSVKNEFETERRLIREQIQRLDESCVCMETYGASSLAPAIFDESAVARCDLFVCLAGSSYGSVEPNTGQSYSELEFGAAVKNRLPCLIYIQEHSETADLDSRQESFLELLRRPERIVNTLATGEDLRNQFIFDLVRELRTTLLEKFAIEPLLPLSSKTIHSLTQGLLEEQVQVVGGDRYLLPLYVHREVETSIEEFIDFEQLFVKRASEHLTELETICTSYRLRENTRTAIDRLRQSVMNGRSAEDFLSCLAVLRSEFEYDEVVATISKLNAVLASRPPNSTRAVAEVMSVLKTLRCVSGAALTDIPSLLEETWRRVGTGQVATATGSYRQILAVFPHSADLGPKKATLANDLIDELTSMQQRANKRCLAIVSPAGTGKTNLLCSIAQHLIKKSPVVLLSGALEISREYDLESHIERYLAASFGHSLSNWLERSEPDLMRQQQWLFIIIDAINENDQPSTMVKRLRALIARIAHRRVKLIVSCRDVGWEQFAGTFSQSLFSPPLQLRNFTEHEWQTVLARYFEHFRIKAEISDEVQKSLRNPVLLRFFCSVHKSQCLGTVDTVALGAVFNSFFEHLRQVALEQLGPIDGEGCIDLLLGAAQEMWGSLTPICDIQKLAATQQNPSLCDRALFLLRSEGVFQQVAPVSPQTRGRTLHFTFDAFMEFVLARAWIESGSATGAASLDALLQKAVAAMPAFGAAGGALLHLDEILGTKGRTINRAISLTRDVVDTLLASRQVLLLYLVERMDFSSVDGIIIDILDRFEQVAAAQVREHLARVVVQILRVQPANEKVRTIVGRILEAGARDEKPRIPKAARRDHKPDDAPFRLPPARHHYSEDTRLSAIALLIGLGDEPANRLADQGIQRLGDVDLYIALEGLRVLDEATDDIVSRTAGRMITEAIPEYRVYCAWLLRNRYGLQPAEYVTRLLIDDDRRVYQYALGLIFDTRMVESELITEIVRKLADPGLSAWHRTNLIRVLGARHRFLHPASAQVTQIVSAVRNCCQAGHPSVRLEAYRCMLAFPEHVSVEDTLAAVRSDSDRYVRAIATSHGRPLSR